MIPGWLIATAIAVAGCYIIAQTAHLSPVFVLGVALVTLAVVIIIVPRRT